MVGFSKCAGAAYPYTYAFPMCKCTLFAPFFANEAIQTLSGISHYGVKYLNSLRKEWLRKQDSNLRQAD